MERFVRFVAPRNGVDFVLKAAVLLFILGGLNYLRDLLSLGDGHDSYWNNFNEAAFVGTPFVILTLFAMGHMHRLHEKLAMLAATDFLTGLPNRRAFLSAFEASKTNNACDVVMMVDVDHFKCVNDTYGHAVGDLCLKQLAVYLRQQLRPVDTVARMGGEEFAVLLIGASMSRAAEIADRIASGDIVEAESHRIRVTTSVGYTTRCADMPIDVVLKMADGALYQAKKNGRACAVPAAKTTVDAGCHGVVA